MTPSGIEPATFRFVAQHLNHCATVVPNKHIYIYIYRCVNLLYYKQRGLLHFSATRCGHIHGRVLEGCVTKIGKRKMLIFK